VQRLIASFYRSQIRFAVIVAIGLAFIAGAFATTRAQGQQCRDFETITVCGDTLGANAGRTVITGNLKIGPKGKPPVILVRDIADESDYDAKELKAVFDLDQGTAALDRFTARVYGEVSFADDLTAEPLMGSLLFRKNEEEVVGTKPYFDLDIREGGNLFLPANAVQGFRRNEGMDLAFLDRAGVLSLGMPEFTIIEANVDLAKGELQALVPVKLETLPDADPIDVRITIDANGILKSNVSGFSATFAGMTARFMDVELLEPFAAAPATRADGAMLAQAGERGGLKIGAIEFCREDNPSLPNLDPSDPGLVFKVEGVEYRNKRFQIRGTAPIRDWQVGNAFQLTDQRLTIGFSQVTRSYELTINSMMTFAGAENAVSDTTRYPVSLTVGAQQNGNQTLPIFRGTLGAAQPNLGIGMLRIRPQGVGLEFNPARNFYGLVAEKVSLQWNSQGGGASGPSLDGFRLGIDKDKNLVFNLGAGGEVELPAFRSSVFTGTMRGSFSARDGVLAGIFTGRLAVALPGNSGVAPEATLSLRRGKGVQSACPANSTPQTCIPAYDMRLSAFELKLAGFSMALANPQGLDGGGVAASLVTLKTPAGLSFVGGAGVQVRGLRIAGNGSVSIDGGGFDLPPIRAGGYEFTSVKGFFAKTATEYEFRAGATLPLPGMSSSGSKQIKADMTFRTRPDGSFLGTGVKLNFNTGSPGIPLGTTGMELVRLGGSFDTGSGATRVGVTLRAVSTKQLRGIPVATVDGQAQLQIRPFQLTANARLSLLVVQVAQASVGIGAGQGFNGGDGFYAQLTIDVRVARGDFLVRMGNLTLSNGTRRFSVAISAVVDVGIKKHQFARYIPPFNIDLARVRVQGGDFIVKGREEALGVVGSARCCWGTLSASFFIDLRSGDVKMIDPDNYRLIGAAQVRANAAAGVAGYSVRAVSVAQLAAERGVAPQALLGQPLEAGIARADQPLLSDDMLIATNAIPFTVTRAGTTLFGISYPTGNPVLTLEGPNGLRYVSTQLTNSDTAPAIYLNEGNATEGFDRAIVVRNAPVGNYTLFIDNAPASYEQVFYQINQAPIITQAQFVCSGFDGSPLVDTRCDGQPSGDGVVVNYRLSDPDGPESFAYAGFIAVDGAGNVAPGALLRVVQEGLPINSSLVETITLGTSGIPSGRYRAVIGVRDGANAPVEQLSPMVITVTDSEPPAQLPFLNAESGPGAVLALWEPSPWMDVAGYEVGFGPTNNPANFSYVRDLGPLGPEDLDDFGRFSATLWGVGEDETVYVSARAYDQDGNKGAWAAPIPASSWPLAPNGQSPLPGGVAFPTTSVQLMFGSPLVAGTFNQRLELLDAERKAVPGRASLITDPATGKLFGLRFVPNAPLAVGKQYEVILKAGVLSEDDRGMPEDYRWVFTVVATTADGLVPPEPVGALAPPAEGGIPGQIPGHPGAGTRLYLPLVRR
jgi:hypothetical protein